MWPLEAASWVAKYLAALARIFDEYLSLKGVLAVVVCLSGDRLLLFDLYWLEIWLLVSGWADFWFATFCFSILV